MWEMIKDYCNHDKKEIVKLLVQCSFVGIIGAAWFYLMALGMILLGG